MTDEIDVRPVLVERRGAVTIITLNRPSARNSINAALATALGEALEDLASDESQRVGILTGAGTAFCAGMDLKAFVAGESVEPVGHPEWGFGGYVQHFIDKPLIAAVNGFAFGGGAELALASDLIVADEDATIALPEVARGLFPAAGGLIRIAQQITPRRALEMVLTGAPIDAATALEWGLINRVAVRGRALETAIELAEQIAANAPLAVRASKRIVYDTLHLDAWGQPAWQLNQREMDGLFASDDALEGARSFAEKRRPVWTGR